MALDDKPDFPRWVRILAVFYVLSWMVSPWLFVILGSLAGARWTIVRQFDGWVLGCLLGAVGCPAISAAFRWWFRNYGRRRWPETESNDSPASKDGNSKFSALDV